MNREIRYPDFDPDDDCTPNAQYSWVSSESDPVTDVEVDSQRWRTHIYVTLASGHVHTFVCERDGSGEQGCWHFLDGKPEPTEREKDEG